MDRSMLKIHIRIQEGGSISEQAHKGSKWEGGRGATVEVGVSEPVVIGVPTQNSSCSRAVLDKIRHGHQQRRPCRIQRLHERLDAPLRQFPSSHSNSRTYLLEGASAGIRPVSLKKGRLEEFCVLSFVLRLPLLGRVLARCYQGRSP